jgi:serine/threonine-protein kinase HipA
LLASVGHDLPGAVKVVEDGDAEVETEEQDTEADARAVPRGPFADGTWRFSLAGVAMKFSMVRQGERFTAPGSGEGGDWIIKLPDPAHRQVPLNEFAMMTLARLAGIDVPEVRMVHRDQLASVPAHLWPSNEDFAYAIRRFDRRETGDRVHIEDLAQVRGLYPRDKYRTSFETVGALLYRGHDELSLIEFVRRLAFNILIGNGDAHLKNWTLIYRDPRIPQLAPVYDLVATAVYRPSGEKEDLGLKFGGSRDFDSVSLPTFERLQRKLQATHVPLVDVVSHVVRDVLAGWPQVAALLEPHTFLIEKIAESISKRARLLLLR